MSLLVLIIPFSFIAIWMMVHTYLAGQDWRLSFLLTVISANVYLVVITEVLSLAGLLNRTTIFIGWTLPIFFLTVLKFIPVLRKEIKLPSLAFRSYTLLQLAQLLLIVFVILVTGLVAFFAPPNTPDVLNYHMPRVMHWIQNQSVRHYPSGIEIQNSYPPASEYQVLQLVILAGSDRLANFASWFILLASAVCVSYLGEILGMTRTGQILSCLFLVTLPAAILQASSVKNDLHVAFWVLLVFTLILSFFYSRETRSLLLFVFLSIGLGFLTKANTMVFLIPILIWFAIEFIRRKGLIKAVQWGVIALLIFSMLNAGYLLRNLYTFGTPVDSYQSARLMNERITPGSIFSNVLRNASFHCQFPWPLVRSGIELFVLKVHAKLGMDIHDPSITSEGYFSVMGVTTNENLTGNTLHAWASLILSLIYIVQLIKKKEKLLNWLPLIFAMSGYLLFSVLMKWQVFGARYFLPAFFLITPIFGFILSKVNSRLILFSICLGLVFFSWPWLFSAANRPILPQNRYTSYSSILHTDRMVLLLGGDRQGFPGLYQLPGIAAQNQCESIGIYGGGVTTEYQIWAILNAPNDKIRLEWIVAGTPSAAYEDPDFKPCLIICHNCPADQTEIKGLSRVVEGQLYDIYSMKNSTP